MKKIPLTLLRKMAKRIIILLVALCKEVLTEEFASRKARIDSYENMYLPNVNRESILVPSMIQCSQKCVASSIPCIGANFKATSTQQGYECELVYLADASAGIRARENWIYMANNLMV